MKRIEEEVFLARVPWENSSEEYIRYYGVNEYIWKSWPRDFVTRIQIDHRRKLQYINGHYTSSGKNSIKLLRLFKVAIYPHPRSWSLPLFPRHRESLIIWAILCVGAGSFHTEESGFVLSRSERMRDFSTKLQILNKKCVKITCEVSGFMCMWNQESS